MKINKYLLLSPEALVISMLEPNSFGTYLACGTQKRSREAAIYFNLKSDFSNDYFDLEQAAKECVPHADGQPKRTVYVSTYRVLENVPLEAIESLWLATRDGRVLELKQAPLPASFSGRYHLYHELCPVNPLIASTRNPSEFLQFLTDPDTRISVPKICFVELQLGNLEDDPNGTLPANLPYRRMEHLRDCLLDLANQGKTTKTVNRTQQEKIPYRVIKSGFYVGNKDSILYFPFPSIDDLETDHHDWWRSATED